MSTTKAFRGFIPARKKGGNYNNEAVTDMITLTSTGQAQSPSNNIFTGDPVVNCQELTSQLFHHMLQVRLNLLVFSWVVNMLKMESKSSHVIGTVEQVPRILNSL